MGSIFEELIRRFAEASNETAGEHFTPREVIRLMVDLLFTEDESVLRTKRVVRTLYDPAGGHGRHALRGRGVPAGAEPGRRIEGLRAGAQRRVVRHLHQAT
jgi:type I restriction enzyme M protein